MAELPALLFCLIDSVRNFTLGLRFDIGEGVDLLVAIHGEPNQSSKLVAGPGDVLQAPHINVNIFAKGLVRHLFTRIYFEDEASNRTDPVLALAPPDLRGTLIARLSVAPPLDKESM